MALKLKSVIMFFISMPVIAIIGHAYISTENYIFSEVLADYLTETVVFSLRLIWSAMLTKMVYDFVTKCVLKKNNANNSQNGGNENAQVQEY